MKKLKVAAAACGLVVGLAGVAQAALTYDITGVLTKYNQADTTGALTGKIITDDSNKVTEIDLNFKGNSIQLTGSALEKYTTHDFTSSPFNLNYFYNNGSVTSTIKISSTTSTANYLMFDFEDPSLNLSMKATNVTATPTPIPAAAWLLGSGVLGMVGLKRRKTAAA